MRRIFAAVSMLALASAVACGSAPPSGPPELKLGVDACDGCGMAIAEPRYAASAIADDGSGPRTLKFDDIGCLARWESRNPGLRQGPRWVHDRASARWIDADAATYVQVEGLPTPMGSGLVAYALASDADALIAERGGKKLTWDAIRAREVMTHE
jgi:copper chaperone NosL